MFCLKTGPSKKLNFNLKTDEIFPGLSVVHASISCSQNGYETESVGMVIKFESEVDKEEK